ncbi:translation initiation factor IF-2-like [Schistocerca gregaria]|uniref:translation initiation factor IF-2-like n=1 Tax=Schistocerca gregaria TaxID=7010 RepID=UPI00211E731F|nr:translation initiation factor IF-2-like [Schistocerca gregaria]
MYARTLLAVCAAAAVATGCAAAAAPAAAAAAPAAAAPAAWHAPPPHEERAAPFVTGSRSGYGYGGDSSRDARRRAAPRRLVYYADLPDVPAPPYPRVGRQEAGSRGYGDGRGQRWERPLSYSIVDADAQPEADRRREFPPSPPEARYGRLPAPPPPPYYQQRPGPDYYSYSSRPDVDYSGRRPDLDYSARRPDLDYSARRPELDYSARRPELAYSGRPETEGRRTLPLAPVPEHRRPGAPYRGPQGQVAVPGPLLPDEAEPYRGYNPRQPAPWSMQIGARLTVKDDGRRLPFGSGGGNGGGPGRRFYVNSQAPGPHYAVPLRYS